MKSSSSRPKTRADSSIDARLSAAQADELAGRLEGGLSIRDATRDLRSAHGMRVSEMTVSRWAAKRRRAAAGIRFDAACAALEADRAQAATLAALPPAPAKEPEPADAARDFARAHLLLVSQALFVASRDGDHAGLERANRLYACAQLAATRAQRVEVARFAAETGRRRFEYRAAQHELAKDDLAAKEAAATGTEFVPEKDRIQRTVRWFFGLPPSETEQKLRADAQYEKAHAAEILSYRAEAARLRERAGDWEARAEELRQAPPAPGPVAGSETPPAPDREPEAAVAAAAADLAPAEPPLIAKMGGDDPPEPGARLYWNSKLRHWRIQPPPPEETDGSQGFVFPKRYHAVLAGEVEEGAW